MFVIIKVATAFIVNLIIIVIITVIVDNLEPSILDEKNTYPTTSTNLDYHIFI